MEIVLIRHGVRDQTGADGALTEHGEHQTRMLGRALELRGIVPSLVLTSRASHAEKTATLLMENVTPQPPCHSLAALTPTPWEPGGIDDVVQQVMAEGLILSASSCVLVIGHEGRLSNLLTELTGERSHPLGHGEAVCVRARSLEEMMSGLGQHRFRYPTVDHQEGALRAKVNSKMTVATFLAGFVFTALSAVLLGADEWPWHRIVASTALTASLVLFVASVYIYDQLGTPAGFWTDAERPRKMWHWLYDRREVRLEQLWVSRRDHPTHDEAVNFTETVRARLADDDPKFSRPQLDGPVYWLMVETSRRIFTPAVVLALIGFLALLVGTGDWRVWAAGLVSLVGAALFAAWHRPNLGAD